MNRFIQLIVMLWVAAGLVMQVQGAAIQPASVIQTLIDAAEPGDEILVPAGEYQGALTVKDGVIVRGEGDTATIIDGQGAPEVVRLGKESMLIGVAVRNGQKAVVNNGNFVGVFECTIESHGQFGLFFQSGSGVAAHNRILGNGRNNGVLCASANPILVNNLIEGHHIGVYIMPHLIPSIIGNLFRTNRIAIFGAPDAKAVIERNLFDGNGENNTLGPLPEGNEVRSVSAGEFKLERGLPTEAYRNLMMASYRAAVKDHPIIVYDLHPNTGSFDAIALFPWANFVLSASAVDTRIEQFQAYDVVAGQPIHAEYFVLGDARPSVRVFNPELLEKMRERYVLENLYVHGPSYFEDANGRRIFRRMTNMSQIEVVIPSGYRVVSASPVAVLHEGGDRPYLSMVDIGFTDLEVIMERAPAQ